jgi:hypothetical protein
VSEYGGASAVRREGALALVGAEAPPRERTIWHGSPLTPSTSVSEEAA